MSEGMKKSMTVRKLKDIYVPVMALRISVAAASLISSDACSLYQAVWGVQIKLGASLRGPWEKLFSIGGKKKVVRRHNKKLQQVFFCIVHTR